MTSFWQNNYGNSRHSNVRSMRSVGFSALLAIVPSSLMAAINAGKLVFLAAPLSSIFRTVGVDFFSVLVCQTNI